MSGLREELDELRERMERAARVADRRSNRAPRPESAGALEMRARAFPPPGIARHGYARTPRPAHEYAQEWLDGEEVETEFGRHFETEKLYERHRLHGSAEISSLEDLTTDLLAAVSSEPVAHAGVGEWAFLDTETTGLGSGACAFLIGVGRVTREGFRVRQFFLRDMGEEASALDAVATHLAQFSVLITYNGRSYDLPLLANRYHLNRAPSPFPSLDHVDLLHGSRRLWKLRFESCRLVDLETQVLGFERRGDLAGSLIPYVYFEYLRTRETERILPIFHHNATDILTLACLTGIVPLAFSDPDSAALRQGAEMAGVARWLRQAGELEQARRLFRRAIDAGLGDELLFRTLWDVAAIERKLGEMPAALEIWNDLAGSKNPFRAKAMEELAKHYEHREKDFDRALELTRAAAELIEAKHGESPALRKREKRLEARAAR